MGSGSFYENELRERGSDLHIGGWGDGLTQYMWVGSGFVFVGGKTHPLCGLWLQGWVHKAPTQDGSQEIRHLYMMDPCP